MTPYAWSVFGSLEQVMLPDGTEISYELDPTGRRVGRSVEGERTHGWLYRDHLNPVAQLDAEGRLEQVYLYGTQPHVPDAILEIGAGGTVVSTYRVVTDVRGSVRLVVNADTGAVEQELRYSPFGEVLHDSNPGFQPFGFAGGMWDADTGLVRFGAREYDARLGRWLSRDPILFDGGDPNLFGYVLGDPVNWVDPEGLHPAAACTGGAVVGGVLSAAGGDDIGGIALNATLGCLGGASVVGSSRFAAMAITNRRAATRPTNVTTTAWQSRPRTIGEVAVSFACPAGTGFGNYAVRAALDPNQDFSWSEALANSLLSGLLGSVGMPGSFIEGSLVGGAIEIWWHNVSELHDLFRRP